jgi:hypothetical protein
VAEALTQKAFADQIDTKFTLVLEGFDPIELKLSRVSDVIESNGSEGFSIVFKGPGGFVLRQSTYRLEHDVMGALEILLVPIGKDEQGVDYEAVFNRLKAR